MKPSSFFQSKVERRLEFVETNILPEKTKKLKMLPEE